MPFVVLYDANVLWGDVLRDLLVRVAQSGMVQAKWSDDILDETFRSIRAKRPELDPEKLERTRALMCRAVRDCLVTNYQPLVAALELPDTDDRHVLAAAIKCGAQTIVTWNTKHFPSELLSGWGIEAKTPDDFIVDQLHLDAGTVHAAIQQMADIRRNPPMTVGDIVEALERTGLVETAITLRHSSNP
jgi:predicted nucleic acid-binding protein